MCSLKVSGFEYITAAGVQHIGKCLTKLRVFWETIVPRPALIACSMQVLDVSGCSLGPAMAALLAQAIDALRYVQWVGYCSDRGCCCCPENH